MEKREGGGGSENERKAIRLKTLAEQNYDSSDLKSALKNAKKSLRLCPQLDGTAEMVTAFEILCAADAAKGTADGSIDWYKILQIEPFSHMNTVKKQYKKLALTLHPDKNPFAASEEAFKLVGDAFRVLSDKIRRKEFDMKLRIAMQEEAAEEEMNAGVMKVDTFWTACSTCRLLHQFERKYLGHNLMCPSCKKSFKAVEFSEEDEENGIELEGQSVRSRRNSRKMTSVEELLKREESKRNKKSGAEDEIGVFDTVAVSGDEDLGVSNGCGGSVNVVLRSKRVRKPRDLDKLDECSSGIATTVVSERLKAKRAKMGGDEMTLAEMQMLAKKASEKNSKTKEKQKEKVKERKEASELANVGNSKTDNKSSSKNGTSSDASKSGHMEIMTVEDSDFYDFDKDRAAKCFRQGQVWAIFDDDDGMPRQYALIDDVVSVNPFQVKLSLLDVENNVDEVLISWENLGFRICCGKFKVSRKISVNLLNIFSHVVDCDRVAKQLYRIYPKKGSVWALYNEDATDSDGRNLVAKDRRSYDIAVFLTSYSEVHGLSMGYLEKVDGFKSVFKRKDIGGHAIKWLEKFDTRLFSHQIPARKLSGKEDSVLAQDCWELDPASLPAESLTIGWGG